jgi:hypothetical protein
MYQATGPPVPLWRIRWCAHGSRIAADQALDRLCFNAATEFQSGSTQKEIREHARLT